jgi:hypothetical protein
MKKITIIIGILCAILFSCNHGDTYYNPDEICFEKGTVYRDSVLFQNAKELPFAVEGLYSIDNYMIIVQNNRDSVLQVVDMNNGSFLAGFGKIGRAKTEFQSVPQKVYCIRDKNGNPMLCIQENACTKIVDIKKSICANTCVISKIIKEKKDYLFDYTYHLGEQECFNYKTVSYEDARDEVYIEPKFYMEDSDEKWEIFPQIITPAFSNIVDCAYAMMVYVSPNGKHAVGIQNLIDMVTIFDIVNNKSIGIINSDSYTLEYLEKEVNENNIKDELIWYNTSGGVTDNGFVVIKDGDFYRKVAYEEGEDGPSIINYYNWNGEKQFSYLVNKKLKYIAYNEKEEILYAISNADKLYSCKLKKNEK